MNRFAIVLLTGLLFVAGCDSEKPPAPSPTGSTPSGTGPVETAAPAQANWPQWGGSPARNMAAPDAGPIPDTFEVGDMDYDTEQFDPANFKNILWVTKLGSQSYGNPAIVDGRVYLGTNNGHPLDPKFKGDRSNVYCLDQSTGELIWQFSVPKLGAGKVGDWEFLGICSGPAVAGGMVYVATNRCEVVALDVDGMADGNDGPFKTEADYYGGGRGPIEPGPTDADILWRYDMAGELGVFPHNVTSNSALVVGDYVAVGTSNGVDYSHSNIPNPSAPAMVVLNRKTGELFAEEASGISSRTMHSNWASPAYTTVDGKGLYLFAAGDGKVYAFDAEPVEDEDGFMILRERWVTDGVPEEYKTDADGKPIPYARYEGPSEYIGTPVIADGRVYAAIGQDPEHGDGVGAIACMDVATGKVLWKNKSVGRTISTASVYDGLVFIADYGGEVHCIDAETGKTVWTFDTDGHIWASTLVADGKVYIGNEDGAFYVLKAGRNGGKPQVIHELELHAPVYGTPVAVDGKLYIMTQTHLFAIGASE